MSSSDADSDLDDVPLFIMPQRQAPASRPGLSFGPPKINQLPSRSSDSSDISNHSSNGISAGSTQVQSSRHTPPRPGGGFGLKLPPSTPQEAPPMPSVSRGNKPSMPSLPLKNIPNLSTPDPSEALPTSRTSRRQTPPPLKLPFNMSATDAKTDPQPNRSSSMASRRRTSENENATQLEPAGAARSTHKPPPIRVPSDSLTPSPLVRPNSTPAEQQQQDAIMVSVMSSAFLVPRPASDSLSSAPSTASIGSQNSRQEHSRGSSTSGAAGSLLDAVSQKCVSSLGVAPQELRFFELREVFRSGGAAGREQQGLSSGAQHVAVLVNNSGFSLVALEDMLAQNHKLNALQETNAQTISTMYNDVKATQAENVQLSVKSAEQARDIQALQDKSQRLEQEVELLRERLRTCDDQRHKLESTIINLRKGFQGALQQAQQQQQQQQLQQQQQR